MINEVFFYASEKGDTGLEWVEIYNSGDSSQILSGWQLYPDIAGYFIFPDNFIIAPKSYVLIHLKTQGSDSAGDLFHSSDSSGNMGNTSGSVALFSGEPRSKDTVKSFVQWGKSGKTWEAAASEAGIWNKGEFVDVSNLLAGSSVALMPDGAVGLSAWKVANQPTPRVSNSGSSTGGGFENPPQDSAPESTPPPAPQSPPSQVSVSAPVSEIKVNAGDDKTVLAGQEITFSGNASYKDGVSIDSSARFLWNFGDGSTKEGRAVTHIYSFPGKYVVSLNVGYNYDSASDYINVEVLPPSLVISEAKPGKDGFIELHYTGRTSVDIGGNLLKDAGGSFFYIPQGTLVSSGSYRIFPNSITSVFLAASDIMVVGLNNALLDKAVIQDTSLEPGESLIRKGLIMITTQTPTPGFENNNGEYAGVAGNIAENSVKPSKFAAAGGGLSVKKAAVTEKTEKMEKPIDSSGGNEKSGPEGSINNDSGHESATSNVLKTETAAVGNNWFVSLSDSRLFLTASVLIGIVSAAGFFIVRKKLSI